VTVEVGVCASEITDDLTGYLTHRRLGRPYVTLKLGITLDGRTTTGDPSMPWITGAEARADGHRLRAENDAILVGANTVRVDNPRLTTRDAPGADPIRVVLGHAPPSAAVHPCFERDGDVADVLRGLAADGITTLLVEGGAQVAQQFHDAQLVDRYVMYVANATPEDAGPAMQSMWSADVVEAAQIGNDVRVTLTPNRGT
jgi:diaminohydroxyphosphoribosylaminopyrimidine deaminase/5-amino-6-(5-phosphoribosylamino)uracil reductase